MYYLLSLLTGILISVMVAFNGGLTELYGTYTATAIIHVVGLLIISTWVITKRERPFCKRQKWFLYLGGAIGVMTTVFNNLAYGRISVSSIMALGLFGQSVTGLIIDHYGFMDMPRHPFLKRKICGLLLIFCGVVSMTEHFNTPALFISFAAGGNIVLSRTLNAKLADLTSVNVSTFYNYVIGLTVAVSVYFLLGRGEIPLTSVSLSPNFYIYLGGALGVCVVFLSNITVTKISAFYLSLLLFVGQIFAGILVDAVISGVFSPRNLIGGLFVAAGLCVNLVLDRKRPDGADNVE